MLLMSSNNPSDIEVEKTFGLERSTTWIPREVQLPARMSVFLEAMVLIFTMPDSAA